MAAKRDYIEWIIGAKAADTRARRHETGVQWMSEGRSRNWKYMSAKPGRAAPRA